MLAVWSFHTFHVEVAVTFCSQLDLSFRGAASFADSCILDFSFRFELIRECFQSTFVV